VGREEGKGRKMRGERRGEGEKREKICKPIFHFHFKEFDPTDKTDLAPIVQRPLIMRTASELSCRLQL
jgi:hypothetical protein